MCGQLLHGENMAVCIWNDMRKLGTFSSYHLITKNKVPCSQQCLSICFPGKYVVLNL